MEPVLCRGLEQKMLFKKLTIRPNDQSIKNNAQA